MATRFDIRKQVFDYLKANLTGVEILPSHPSGITADLPKIVVEILNDDAAGLFTSDAVEYPVIKITIYANTELLLNKPTGLSPTIESLMKLFCPTPIMNFQKIADQDVGYLDDTLQYCAWICYRFYNDTSNV